MLSGGQDDGSDCQGAHKGTPCLPTNEFIGVGELACLFGRQTLATAFVEMNEASFTFRHTTPNFWETVIGSTDYREQEMWSLAE